MIVSEPDWYNNPWDHTPDALLRAEVEKLQLELRKINVENIALRHENEAWRECAVYDAMMEGPRFQAWNRSALDRCRKKYCEGT